MCEVQYDITYEDLNPTFLFACQLSRSSTPEAAHSHDFCEIALMLSGEGHFVVDGKWRAVKKGDVLLLNPGTVHQCTYSSPLSPLVEFYVSFTDIQLRSMASPISGCAAWNAIRSVSRAESFFCTRRKRPLSSFPASAPRSRRKVRDASRDAISC